METDLKIMKTGRNQKMVCDICGQEGARIRRIAETYGKGKDLLVIENILFFV